MCVEQGRGFRRRPPDCLLMAGMLTGERRRSVTGFRGLDRPESNDASGCAGWFQAPVILRGGGGGRRVMLQSVPQGRMPVGPEGN